MGQNEFVTAIQIVQPIESGLVWAKFGSSPTLIDSKSNNITTVIYMSIEKAL